MRLHPSVRSIRSRRVAQTTRLLTAAVAGLAGATSLIIGFTAPPVATVSAAALSPGDEHGKPGDRRGDKPIGCDAQKLIAAILRAEQDNGGRISLAKGCTYLLPGPVESDKGLPPITTRITIEGNNATITRAASGPAFRLFEVASGGELNLSHLSLIGGRAGVANGGGGAILVGEQGAAHLSHTTVSGNFAAILGGAITNFGELSINHSTLADNHVGPFPLGAAGGAIYHGGASLTIEDTTIRDNISTQFAGGVYAASGTTRLSRVTVQNNRANTGGGGLYLAGQVTIAESDIVDNAAFGNGAGIFIDASSDVRIHKTRITGNTAGSDGGGLFADATTEIDDSSIADNQAGHAGGGLYGFGVTLRDTKIKDNRAIGTAANGAGITGGDITLIDSTVVGNRSSLQPGGVNLLSGSINLIGRSRITENSPTNCTGSTQPVPGCAG